MTALAFDTAAPVMGVCVAAPRATAVISLAVGLEHGTRLAPLIEGAQFISTGFLVSVYM